MVKKDDNKNGDVKLCSFQMVIEEQSKEEEKIDLSGFKNLCRMLK